VLGTGWFGAVAAEAGPGKVVAVVGMAPSACSLADLRATAGDRN
jgi:hypothetical protein